MTTAATPPPWHRSDSAGRFRTLAAFLHDLGDVPPDALSY
jgi:hypothetical protein